MVNQEQTHNKMNDTTQLLAGITPLRISQVLHGERTPNSVDKMVIESLDNACGSACTSQEEIIVFTRVPGDYVAQAIRCCDSGQRCCTHSYIFGSLIDSDFQHDWSSIDWYKYTDTDVAIIVPPEQRIIYLHDYCKTFGESAVVLPRKLLLHYCGIWRYSKTKKHTFLVIGGDNYD